MLQKAVLFYFARPDQSPAGRRYWETTCSVLRWIAELRGDVARGLNARRGGRTRLNLRTSLYRSLKNMEDKGLLIREKRRYSDYTRFIELTPRGITLARQVDPQDFLVPFDRVWEANERKDMEFMSILSEVLRKRHGA